jgi:hypothetical protein
MLTVLRVIDQHRSRHQGDVASSVNLNSFKIIYVQVSSTLCYAKILLTQFIQGSDEGTCKRDYA